MPITQHSGAKARRSGVGTRVGYKPKSKKASLGPHNKTNLISKEEGNFLRKPHKKAATLTSLRSSHSNRQRHHMMEIKNRAWQDVL